MVIFETTKYNKLIRYLLTKRIEQIYMGCKQIRKEVQSNFYPNLLYFF